MTISSAQEDYSITLTDKQIAALNTASMCDTITITNGGSSYYAPCYTSSSGSTISYSNFTASATTSTTSFCIPPLNGINITKIWQNTEWVDSFPDWTRIEKMCEEYPGLRLAFEKFKNTYNLVKDDFDAPPEKRIKP